MESIDCLFRHDIRRDETGETARCGLIEQAIQVPANPQSRIPRDACKACLQFSTASLFDRHPVLSSLLFQQCDATLSADSSQPHVGNELERTRLVCLRDRAEAALREQSDPTHPIGLLPCCDVILCAHKSTPELERAIESVLNQIDAAPFIHLIDTGDAAAVFNRYQKYWNVRRHRLPRGTLPLAALHEIVETLKTPFVLFQSAEGVSEPDRISVSVRALIDKGAEIYVSQPHGRPIATTDGVAGRKYPRRVDVGALTLRRATFVDMGGVIEERLHQEIEFFHRAIWEERTILVGQSPLISPQNQHFSCNDPPHDFLSISGQPRLIANGFPVVRGDCDVVLPFHGHLDYVEQSLRGLLDQCQADVVIHLIDDASNEDTSVFLRTWSQHPQVRAYRNRENVGQFQSFNAVSPFFETNYVAVQDADDISLPHRIQKSTQMLHYCGADFFAGAVELFGDASTVKPTTRITDALQRMERATVRRSAYPVAGADGYFAENPTAVFRVSMFRDVGGFADFGDRLLNRASLDTEFQQRCRYHGVRFAISREIVVQYRVHAESATRNRLTGWGTAARTSSGQQFRERCRLFRRGRFDPKSFGALDRLPQVTERL